MISKPDPDVSSQPEPEPEPDPSSQPEPDPDPEYSRSNPEPEKSSSSPDPEPDPSSSPSWWQPYSSGSWHSAEEEESGNKLKLGSLHLLTVIVFFTQSMRIKLASPQATWLSLFYREKQ